MLDLRFVVNNADQVKQILANRSGTFDVDAVVELDARRREILRIVEELKCQQNRLSAEIGQRMRQRQPADDLKAQVLGDKERIRQLDAELGQVMEALNAATAALPNLPDECVPIGADDSANRLVRSVGQPREFDFLPAPHWELGERLGILDPAAAAKITGARFHVYRGLGARLERAIASFMLDTHGQAGYTEILPPFVVNADSMFGTGQLPKFAEDMFALAGTNYYLVPTAEVPLTNLHRGEVLTSLPIKYTAFTACFRAEAGSAGRDTRGLIRQHQFGKVELVKFVDPSTARDELESLTADAERILQLLGLPYRVMLLCTGDMGFASRQTFDIEVWMPSYGRFVEISSCSWFGDFQARRMGIKMRTENGQTQLVHTLNGSGLAVGRTTAAILENCQQADGSVVVPEVLRPYLGTDVIS